MNKQTKLATATRMLAVAMAAVEREYADCHTGKIYAKDSNYRKACYRANELTYMVNTLQRELGIN
jgi:hypothetical protein